MSPQRLIVELAERAFWQGHFAKGNRRDPGKPGEFFSNLPPEEREILKDLKSDDLRGIRFDAVSFMAG